MALLHIVLADPDEEYVFRLTDWLRENREHQFKMTVFTEKESFQNYLAQAQNESIVVLAAESFLDKHQNTVDNLILLGRPEKNQTSNLQYIEKYQPAPGILSDILSIVSKWNKEMSHLNKSGKSDLILCLSTESRLKSTLALWMAKMSAEHIYMNFESFPFYLLNDPGDYPLKNLSDILYHMKAARRNTGIVLESVVYTDTTGINYVPPMDNPGDMWALSEKENELFLEVLSGWGRFSRIIADVELDGSERTRQWIRAAAKILIPYDESQAHQIFRIQTLFQSLPDFSPSKVTWIKAGLFRHYPENETDNSVHIPALKAFPPNWKERCSLCEFSNELMALIQ